MKLHFHKFLNFKKKKAQMNSYDSTVCHSHIHFDTNELDYIEKNSAWTNYRIDLL